VETRTKVDAVKIWELIDRIVWKTHGLGAHIIRSEKRHFKLSRGRIHMSYEKYSHLIREREQRQCCFSMLRGK
jgi:hypothetical protein